MKFYFPLAAGLDIFLIYWKELGLLMLMWVSAGSCVLFLFGSENDSVEGLWMKFTAGGWGLISLVAPVLSLLKIFTPSVLLIVMIAGTLAGILAGNWKEYLPRLFSGKIWIPLLLWIFFLVLYLGFMEDLWLPPYHDSPYHYQFVKQFLIDKGQGWRLFTHLFSSYYHLGYHGITAWMSSLAGDFPPLYITLTGQFFLALFPVTVYYLVLSITGSPAASLLSSLASGLGWLAPLQAANWGKYPLILGLAVLPAVLVLFSQRQVKFTLKDRLFLLVVSCSLIWMHSRFAVVLVLLLLCYQLVYRWKIGVISTVGLGVVTLALWHFDGAPQSLNYYLGVYRATTIGGMLFLPFSMIKDFQKTIFWVLFLLLLILCSWVALPAFFQRYSYTLIDAGFLTNLLVLPLVILAGMGVAAWMDDKHWFYAAGMIAALAGLLFWNAGEKISFLPQQSSVFSSWDDLLAMEWIKDELPGEATILISGKKRQGDWEGQDAGIWIEPLTGRNTEYLPYNTTWCDPDVQRDHCESYAFQMPLYIYQGQMSRSFSGLQSQPCGGIEEVLRFSNARLFSLACQGW